jgi:hypothetical protein
MNAGGCPPDFFPSTVHDGARTGFQMLFQKYGRCRFDSLAR